MYRYNQQSLLIIMSLLLINFQATISEIQRLARVAPLSLAHRTLAVTEVDGFTFPAGSVFYANLSCITRDPSNFPRPDMFDPDRFIDVNGK